MREIASAFRFNFNLFGAKFEIFVSFTRGLQNALSY